MARFSVLMANYNNGRYIGDAVNSVITQTFPDWELVIVDDASTDNSREQLNQYLSDPRIRLYVKARNDGYVKALTYGLAKTSTELIGILDSDDALVPEALEKVYATFASQPKVGLILTQVLVCDEALHPLYTTSTTPQHSIEPILWMRGPNAFRSFRRSAYNRTSGLDVSMRHAEDWDLHFKLEEVSDTFRLNEELYRYRQLGTSASKDAEKNAVGFRSTAKALYAAYRRRLGTSQPNLPRPALLAWLVAGVRYCINSGDRREAALFAVRALRVGPAEGASWRALWSVVRAAAAARPEGSTMLRWYPVRWFQSGTGNIEPDRVTCCPLVHKSGHCLYGGDHLILHDGSYTAVFELKLTPLSFAEDPIVILDVYENLQQKKTLGQHEVSISNASGQLFYVDFDATEGDRVECRVYWREQCYLQLSGVRLYRNNVVRPESLQ